MSWLDRWYGRRAWRNANADVLETAQAALCQLESDKDHALDALEGMVTAHLGNDEGSVDHWNMMANVYACDVLVRYRPERWRATDGGIERADMHIDRDDP